jgi:excisionase family DNA binding protein
MNTDQLQINNGFRLMKPGEVADLLNVNKSHVYILIQTRSLPSVRIGKSVRVNYHDLLIYINSSKEPIENTIIQKKKILTVSLSSKFNKSIMNKLFS